MKTGKRHYSLVAIAACALGAVPTVHAQLGLERIAHSEPATLENLRRARDALFAVAELEPALDLARQVVAALESYPDTDPSEDLLQLALIQAALEDYAAAESTYLRVIEIREHRQGVFSPALIPPLQALGRAYIDSGRYGEALTVLEHARSISQRNLGLFNLKQAALLDDMTRAHLASGDRSAAHGLQLERLRKAIRHFGADAPELVPFHRHLGDYYYEHVGDLYGNLPSNFRAHDQYMRALEIRSGAFSDATPESLELLRRLTAVEMLLNHRPPARDRLLAALDSGTEISAKERGLSLAVLGDWANVEGDQASAERYYSAAYAAFREAAEGHADEWFAAPKMLDFVPPPDGVGGGPPGWAWGSIELAFDVSPAGRASNVRTLIAEPAGHPLESEYKERITAAHFRPSLLEGRPVARADVRFSHRFRYYERD